MTAALLKQGLAFKELGDLSSARIILKELINLETLYLDNNEFNLNRAVIELGYDSNNDMWSGINTITGVGSFILQVEKTINTQLDILDIFYSGETNITGGITTI